MDKSKIAEDVPEETPLWIRGEHLLGREIIYLAFDDIAKGVKAESDEMDAMEWVTSDNREPFSFLWWCENLDMNEVDLINKAKGIANERQKRIEASKRESAGNSPRERRASGVAGVCQRRKKSNWKK